ncbi:hypothetical protein HKX48_002882 [Thoreauomyces humboldtii]|nr:hypothetical protein HKX48_002882 [Thoreauomyces humboldtii]
MSESFRVASPVATLIILAVALIFSVVSAYLRTWWLFSLQGINFSYGLFALCMSGDGVEICENFDDDSDTSRTQGYRKAAAAMMIFAIISLFLAVGGSIAAVVGRKGKVILIAIMSCTVLSILFEILAVALMATDAHTLKGAYYIAGYGTVSMAGGSGLVTASVSLIVLVGALMVEILRRDAFMEKW